MKIFRRKKRKKILSDETLTAGEKARKLYRAGDNCAQAVLQATCAGASEEMIAMADVFGGGIDNSKCLCGAVTGATISLSLQGHGDKASRLVDAFREQYRTTCCKGLTARFEWMSREHLEACREMTAETADMVNRLLKDSS